MSVATSALRCSLLALLIVAVSGLLSGWWWFAELLVSLRVQQLCVLVPLVVLAFLLRTCWRWRLLGVVLLFWHIWWLRSAWISDGRSVEQGLSAADLTVCVSNVQADNPDMESVLRSLRACDADVIAVLELTTALRIRLQSEFAADYPYFIFAEREPGHFGIGVLSRLPLSSSAVVNYRLPSVPSIEAELELRGGDRVHLIATHPRPPMDAWQHRMRNEHLDVLAARVVELRAASQLPVIVMGDLNVTPWSPTFARLQDRAGLRSVTAGGGLEPTWYSRPYFVFGLVLDHVLHTEGIGSLRRRILPGSGSDHRAVLVSLRLE
jgi:endonuclease/exonuclease/phosphatase (EEP) superfamily protein YafD